MGTNCTLDGLSWMTDISVRKEILFEIPFADCTGEDLAPRLSALTIVYSIEDLVKIVNDKDADSIRKHIEVCTSKLLPMYMCGRDLGSQTQVFVGEHGVP